MQGVSLWTIKSKVEPAIMSVSKEIRDEASNVVKKFEWARITVDVDYYSTQLQERGFIMSANDANKIPGKSSIEPVLEVDVKFGGDPPGKDQFFCSSVELPGLCRALSLTLATILPSSVSGWVKAAAPVSRSKSRGS